MAVLRVLREGVEVKSVDLAALGKASVSIGRAENADIQLDDRAIGREHAVFLISNGGIAVQKKSKFGKLSVNGAEVGESVVKAGDVINIADYLVRIEEGAPAAQKAGAAGAGLANEVTPPAGTPAPALEAADASQISEGNTPGMGIAAPDGAAAGDAAGIPLEAAPAIEQPSMEAPAAEVAMAADSGLAEQPTGGGAMSDGGFAAEGGDRTAMISTAHMITKLVFKPGEANLEEFVLKKGEISIGRGTTCDVVLTDKKSSRKHLIIKKVGMNFVAQDLGSGNGTYVNDNKITEQELAGDDVIRIGDTEFTFKASSSEYFQQEQNQEFIAPPAEEPPPEEAPVDQGMMMAGGDPNAGMMIDPATGLPLQGGIPQQGASADPSLGGLGGTIPGMPGTGGPKKKQTLLEKFKALPPKKRLMIGAGVGLVMIMAMMDDDDGKKKKTPTPQPTVAVAPNSPEAAFNALPAEKKQFVLNEYQLGYDLYKKGEYSKALYEIDKVHEILALGYKDSKDIATYAKRAIDIQAANQAEEERKKREEALRKEVAELVTQAEQFFNNGKDTEAKDIFAKVLEKDPENPTILRLRQQMEERDQKKKAEEEAAREKEFKKKQLEATIKEGEDLLAAEKFYEAIDKMNDAMTIYAAEESVMAAGKAIIEKAKATLRAKTKPHLDAAKSSFDAGDFQKARDEWRKALDIDNKVEGAREGIAKIRDILHERSRKIYIEAAVAEGVSDFKTAKIKYKECLDQAVQEDSYFGMCQRKFKRFELVDRATASTAPSTPTNDPAPPKLPTPVEAPADEPPAA
ncbi:MAG: FHA domain-containing protein, partial [Deltaproteobacteria bacterium]|nr:FHA domain-containing protein [Deltaproteobacteria bacterium]